MTCQNCKFWEFPTSAFYQKIYTKGYCAGMLPVKMTYPDEICDKFKAEDKSKELRQAVLNALPQIKRERFGKKMNVDDEIKAAESKLKELRDKKLADDRKALANTANLKPDHTNINTNDMVTVKYKEPLKIAQAYASKKGGDVLYYACVKPDKTLVLINTAECEVIKC
jgi:alanyl-tRNA synthetase